ncbi:iron ABC transporter permease [Paenibacillus massiliensis]|nr:iron ABC transporter permease [Paenibacillus massiliensis]
MKMNGKAVSVIGGSALLLVLLLLLHLMQGQVDISVSDLVHSLLDAQGSIVDQAIWGLRLPRAVAGILCGAALATSGVLLQTVLRNPLASASTLGINAGAYLAVVAGTVWSPFLLHQFSFVFALAGGILAAGMAYVLVGGHQAPPIRLVLSGLIVTLLLSSLTSMMQILYLEDASHLFLWGSGSLMQNNWHGLQLAWHWMVIGLALVFLSGKSLDLLTLGEESATSLGQRMVWTKVAMSGIAITLAALSVSLAGPIGYIGLLAPHIIRLTGIRRHRLLIPASAMLGAGLLLVADLLISMFQATYGTLPVGAVTALLGGGWLVVFALRTHKKRQGIGGFAGMPSMSSVSSFRANKARMLTAYLLLDLALLGVTLYGCLRSGHSMLTMEQLIQTLLGYGEASHHYLVWQLRMPRMAAAWLGGAALAVAGLLIQSAVRNPMADPSVVGVTSGAGAGVLALLVIWPYAPGADGVMRICWGGYYLHRYICSRLAQRSRTRNVASGGDQHIRSKYSRHSNPGAADDKLYGCSHLACGQYSSISHRFCSCRPNRLVVGKARGIIVLYRRGCDRSRTAHQVGSTADGKPGTIIGGDRCSHRRHRWLYRIAGSACGKTVYRNGSIVERWGSLCSSAPCC